MSNWVSVGTAERLTRTGAMQAVTIGDLSLCVARLENGSLAAFDEWCTHEECQLSEGDLEGERVLCYCHGSEFDVQTGAVLRGPAVEPIRVYDVRVVGDELQVRIDETS